MARNAPVRSSAVKAPNLRSIFPSRAHSRTAGVACKATTRMIAPVSKRPLILGSPTCPAPTTRTCRPSSFRNMGNKLVTDPSCLRPAQGRIGQIACYCGNNFAGEKVAQLRIGVPGEKPAQILSRFALVKVVAEQTLECVLNIGGGATIADGPRSGLMQS